MALRNNQVYSADVLVYIAHKDLDHYFIIHYQTNRMVQARFVFHEMVAFGHRVATSNQMIQLACINGWVEEFSMLLIHYSKDPCFSVIHYNISSLSHERIEFTMRSRLEHSIDINSQHLN
jgi:hypothetical protein